MSMSKIISKNRFVGSLRIRQNFSKIPQIADIPNLIEVLKEFREAFETSTPSISVPLGGNTHTVRTLTTVSSLEQLEAWQDELTSNKMLPFRERIKTLIVEQSVEINRIVHRNRP